MDFETKNKIRFSSEILNIKQAEDLVDDVCQTYNIPAENYGNILISVTEAVNNAIVHGNQNDKNKHVTIEVKRTDYKLYFIVQDEGIGFDYTHLPDPTAPENIEKETGRGIFLMRSLADEVVFENKGSSVMVSFNL